MKKIVLFLVLSILIINIVPADRFDAAWWEGKFESNPDKTWERFKDTPGLWSDEIASNAAFEFDSEKALDMINQEIAQKYPSLQSISLDQENFFIGEHLMGLIDKEAQKNINIINENIFSKKEWLAQKGIIDEGAEIETYDGSIIKTKGPESTMFDITDEVFSGAKILPSGKLILKDGTKISSLTISKTQSGKLIFQGGGQVDLSPLSEIEFNMKEGEIKIGEKTYSNDLNEIFHVSSKEGFVTLKGKEIIERDESGLTLTKFTGIVKTNGHKVLGEETSYTLFSNGEESRTYNVDKKTEFHTTQGNCENSLISCIEEVPSLDDLGNDIRVVSKNNNEIKIKTFDDSINKLEIEQIKDDSSVIFNKKDNVILTFASFTSSPSGQLTVQGDLSTLDIDVSTTVLDEYGQPKPVDILDNELIYDGKPVGTSFNPASKISDNANKFSKDKERSNQIRKESKDIHGADPKDHIFLLRGEKGKPLIKAENKAVESANKNEKGAKITQNDLHTTFLSETFSLFKFNVDSIPIPKGLKEVKYQGNIYKVEKDKQGRSYVVYGEGLGKDYTMPIQEKTGTIISYKGEKYSVRCCEGGDRYIRVDGPYYSAKDLDKLDMGDLGLDVLGAEFKKAQKLGFIPQDVKIGEPFFMTNERGEEVLTADVIGLDNGLIVLAGILAKRKWEAKILYEKVYNSPWDSLTGEQQFYLTTIKFNSAEPKEKFEYLKERGTIMKKFNPAIKGITNPYNNAALRTATWRVAEESGVFKLSPFGIRLLPKK